MSDYIKLAFGVHQYDSDGDVYDEGVFLYIGDHIVLPFENPEALKEFGNQIVALSQKEELLEKWAETES